MHYIVSGEAADFKMPMHMPVTDDAEEFTSRAASGFYGKNSVIAVDRPAWEALYVKTAE